MKKIFLVLLGIIVKVSAVFPQLNMTLVANRPYSQELNDIWGWAATDGTEYALVGTTTGLSIVSLATPANPVEVAFIPGPNSIWRDIKTWGHFAYVTNESADGLLIVDLSRLPAEAPYSYWQPNLPGIGTLRTCHNLYIDENGYCYLAGCNVNSGGMVILDVFSTPGSPILAGKGPPVYAHDVYTRDNKMYASEIFVGKMSSYDVTNKQNPTLLGATNTPFNFTHNIWLSDDGKTAFTTDERADAPVAAYDVSDPQNIVELDQFRPLATLGQGVIPHNVHVWNDWLIISYYTDGGIVVDASRPENLIEVGNFDTFFGGNGFDGAWGAYPFLPSGLVLISDISNGLYVLQPNYVRACWLEGRVTDAATGQSLNGAQVEILSPQRNTTTTDLLGTYRTGQALPGAFQVRFFRQGYATRIVNAELQNGMVTILDVQMEPLPRFAVGGLTVRSGAGTPVAGASILLAGEQGSYPTISGPDGSFSLFNVNQGTYDLYAGHWGYFHKLVSGVNIQDQTSLTVALEPGYQDDFIFDLGWETFAEPDPDGNQILGFWERGEPVGTYISSGRLSNPDFDIPNDLGDACYVTGNRGGSAGFDDVDDGILTLSSPPMDLSTYDNPVLSYYAWFSNEGGNGMPDDSLTVRLSNGQEEVILEIVKESLGAWREQSVFFVKDYLELTNDMRIHFEASDKDPTGHVVEAAVDGFLVREFTVVATDAPREEYGRLSAFPNPFRSVLTLDYQLPKGYTRGMLRLYNALGQHLQTIPLPEQQGRVQTGEQWPAGLYIARIEAGGQAGAILRVIKE